MNKDIIIVDIDGTVCDSSKRLASVNFDPTKPVEEWPKDWGDHSLDEPIDDMIEFVQLLFAQKFYIYFVTIRNPSKASTKWIDDNLEFYDKVYHLGDNSTTPPAELKRNFILELPKNIRERIFMAIDDSPSMLKMFKELGIKTLDVGQFAGSM